MGAEIKDHASCKEACDMLGLKSEEGDLQEGQQCYTRGNKDRCFQDGKMDERGKKRKLICRKMKDNHGRYNLKDFII